MKNDFGPILKINTLIPRFLVSYKTNLIHLTKKDISGLFIAEHAI